MHNMTLIWLFSFFYSPPQHKKRVASTGLLVKSVCGHDPHAVSNIITRPALLCQPAFSFTVTSYTQMLLCLSVALTVLSVIHNCLFLFKMRIFFYDKKYVFRYILNMSFIF